MGKYNTQKAVIQKGLPKPLGVMACTGDNPKVTKPSKGGY